MTVDYWTNLFLSMPESQQILKNHTTAVILANLMNKIHNK